jgi:hypothetical protein
MSMVQVGHFSPDAPAVDILVDGDMVFEGIAFRETTDLAELDSGTYNVEVRPEGEDDSVLEDQIELEDGMHYTVIASGLVSDEDLSLEIIAHED